MPLDKKPTQGEESSSQLAHTCGALDTVEQKAFVSDIGPCCYLQTYHVTHPLLAWHYHPQLKMTNQFEKPIASCTHKQNLVAPG